MGCVAAQPLLPKILAGRPPPSLPAKHLKYFHPEVDQFLQTLVVLGKQRQPGTSRPGWAKGGRWLLAPPPAQALAPPPKYAVGVRLPEVCVLDEAAHQLPGISAAAPAGRDGG